MQRSVVVLASLSLWLMSFNVSATEPSAGTGSDLDALMQVVFPRWEPQGPQSVRTLNGGASFAVKPLLVATLADRVVLVVAGTPADASGEHTASHASTGVLSAYWLMRREKQWHTESAQPVFAEIGFSGDVGNVRLISLGGGVQAVAVESGSCWQGQCGAWLALFKIETTRVSPLFAGDTGVMVASDSRSVLDGCDALLKRSVGAKVSVARSGYSTNIGCYAIGSTWRIEPNVHGVGDLVIDYSGKLTTARASASKLAYVLSVRGVKQRLVFRFADSHYVQHSGKNPASPI